MGKSVVLGKARINHQMRAYYNVIEKTVTLGIFNNRVNQVLLISRTPNILVGSTKTIGFLSIFLQKSMKA